MADMVSFQKSVEHLSDTLADLRNISQLFQKQLSLKRTTVLSDADTRTAESKLTHLEDLFSQRVADCRTKLKDLRSFLQSDSPLPVSARQQHYAGLATQLRTIVAQFRKAQVSRKEHEDATPPVPSKEGKNERVQRIAHIAKVIGELCALIDELHACVESMSCKIDRIEVTTATGAEATQHGAGNLRRALRYRLAAMRWKRLIAGILSFFIILLLTYIAYQGYKVSKSNT